MNLKDKKILAGIQFKLNNSGNDIMETLAKYGLTSFPLFLTILAMYLDYANYSSLFSESMNTGTKVIPLITFGLVFVADGAPLALAYLMTIQNKRWFHWVCMFVLFAVFSVVIGLNYMIRCTSMREMFDLSAVEGTSFFADASTTTTSSYTPSLSELGITLMIASEPLGTSIVVFVFGIVNDTKKAVYMVRRRKLASLERDLARLEGMLKVVESQDFITDIDDYVAELKYVIDAQAEEEKVYADHLIVSNGSCDAAGWRDDRRRGIA